MIFPPSPDLKDLHNKTPRKQVLVANTSTEPLDTAGQGVRLEAIGGVRSSVPPIMHLTRKEMILHRM